MVRVSYGEGVVRGCDITPKPSICKTGSPLHYIFSPLAYIDHIGWLNPH